ncbi:MAG: asparagine synthase (glutamine-hydrolyzing) [Chloroflexi bacterium]|nr:asparagine synthase (glutamine-hydrolyzing) [Chloroflexota bacterium]MBE3114147.1 asparagine synthase (glutamine-hydrolyzing) [Actinomycetota bacterium]
MCGICGFNWNDEKLIQRMVQKIHHRGPDSNGVKTFPTFSLGNARLSILDLSDRGNQPMSSREGKLWIVYNGEVYNFPEIKKELLARGYQFNSNTDTEVVLKSYEEYGPGCLQKFNGMFAIAIWDEEKKELFLARDRIGIKPLYYYFKDGILIFGSEIKSILEADCVKKEVNLQSMYYYLGYEFVPAPDTMFQNIYKLRQGHYAIFKNGNLQIQKYWDLKFKPEITDEEEAADRIFAALEKSVKRRLISDVPLGVFLSGGLDSSTVVGFVSRLYPKKVQTFSIGYKDKTFSELPYAKIVSDFFKTEHNVLMIDPVSPEDIERSLYHLDEPMTDLSTIPFYLICCKAREKVTVCLSGEGGDEMFLGYDRFKAARINRYYNIFPSFLRKKVITPLILKLPDQPQKKGAINILKRFIEGTLYPEEVGAMRWQYFLNPKIEQNIFNEASRGNISFTPFDPIYYFSRTCNSTLPIDRDIFVDIKLTMADSVLMKVDKMSMATSLEVRVPFLDHEVAELCASIPANLKFNKLTTKYILRKTLKKYNFLPESIINRGKQGYSLPVKNWLREELKDYMVDLLKNSPIIKENFDSSYLSELIKEHLELKHNHNHILWALINLSLWYKKFFL